MLITLVNSQPAVPKNIKGFVYDSSGGGMPNGIPVRIIDQTNPSEANTEVFAPPVFPGAYSTTIIGTTGDSVYAIAWNSTNYGLTNATLDASTTEINITMNLTRPSELNVTIIAPANETQNNVTIPFNITINVTNLGNQQGTGCDLQILFSNESMLNVTTSNVNNLGIINIGETVTSIFEVVGGGVGSVNVTINGSCDTDGINIERENNDTITLILIDEIPPVPFLVDPANNTLNTTVNNVTFTYNVTDTSIVQSCSLIINGTINQTDSTITKNTNQTFSLELANGDYNWSINCTDIYGNVGSSFIYNISIFVFDPTVLIYYSPASVSLVAGVGAQLNCNFTVEDLNGEADINTVNSTFYFVNNASSDPDDNNVHYSNSSCTQQTALGNQRNYSCSFFITYYAVNGTWLCNGTAVDDGGNLGSNTSNITVDPLFALNTSTSLIDYGDLGMNQISQEFIVNVTNLGNQPLDVSLRGYGGADPVSGNGLSMVCNTNNITVGQQRFSPTTSAYVAKTALSSSEQSLGYTLPKQTTASLSTNTSFWQIEVPGTEPPLGEGFCNGTIIFEAELV